MSQRRFTRGPWRAGQVSIRGHKVWAVLNGHRDPVAIVYTTEADARCMAAAPKLHAYVKKQAKRGDVEALALVNELEGN